jgi:hypothetical protein
MPESQVHLIVFSKDRPLQLHGYLTSLFAHWRGRVRVDCLIRKESPYARAYEAVWEQTNDSTRFTYQDADFAAILTALLKDDDAPYVCFGCDDVVFTGPVLVEEVDAAFREHPDLLGYSLRLGKNVELDMFGRPMAQPPFLPSAGPVYDEYGGGGGGEGPRWSLTEGAGDWGYPWEVLGTVYPAGYVRATVAALVRDGQVQNPSTLEDAGWRRWREHAGERHLMQSYPRSRLVVPTVNVVQSVFGNGIVGAGGLDPAFLLDCWDRGLRLDVQAFRGMAPASWRISDFHLKRAA